MKLITDSGVIEQLIAATGFERGNRWTTWDDPLLDKLTTYWAFFDEEEDRIRAMTGASFAEFLYSKFYWANQCSRRHRAVYGSEGYFDEELVSILEETPWISESGEEVDWALLEQICSGKFDCGEAQAEEAAPKQTVSWEQLKKLLDIKVLRRMMDAAGYARAPVWNDSLANDYAYSWAFLHDEQDTVMAKTGASPAQLLYIKYYWAVRCRDRCEVVFGDERMLDEELNEIVSEIFRQAEDGGEPVDYRMLAEIGRGKVPAVLASPAAQEKQLADVVADLMALCQQEARKSGRDVQNIWIYGGIDGERVGFNAYFQSSGYLYKTEDLSSVTARRREEFLTMGIQTMRELKQYGRRNQAGMLNGIKIRCGAQGADLNVEYQYNSLFPGGDFEARFDAWGKELTAILQPRRPKKKSIVDRLFGDYPYPSVP